MNIETLAEKHNALAAQHIALMERYNKLVDIVVTEIAEREALTAASIADIDSLLARVAQLEAVTA